MFDDMNTFSGLKVIVQHPTPKMQLSATCPVSDEFRAEFNLWLIEFFGYTSILEKGKTLVFKDTLIIRADDYHQLREMMKTKQFTSPKL